MPSIPAFMDCFMSGEPIMLPCIPDLGALATAAIGMTICANAVVEATAQLQGSGTEPVLVCALRSS